MFIQNGAAGLARRRRRYSRKGNTLPVYKNRAGLSVFLVTGCGCERWSALVTVLGVARLTYEDINLAVGGASIFSIILEQNVVRGSSFCSSK